MIKIKRAEDGIKEVYTNEFCYEDIESDNINCYDIYQYGQYLFFVCLNNEEIKSVINYLLDNEI